LFRSAVVLGLFGPELLQEKYDVSYADQSIFHFVNYQQLINERQGFHFQPINPYELPTNKSPNNSLSKILE
jgi:hypothetical protein